MTDEAKLALKTAYDSHDWRIKAIHPDGSSRLQLRSQCASCGVSIRMISRNDDAFSFDAGPGDLEMLGVCVMAEQRTA